MPVVVVILVLFALASYFILHSLLTKPQESMRASHKVNLSRYFMTRKPLKSIMMAASNQQCKFQDAKTGSSGMLYIGTGKVRGDFSSAVNSVSTTAHLFSDTVDAYIWSSTGKTGTKIPLEMAITNIQNSGLETIDINTPVDYKCSDWVADSARFALPTTVRFREYSATMVQGATTNQSSTNEEAPPQE